MRFPLDLHVLGTPPAFVLSQDQTLRREPSIRPARAGFGFVQESRPPRAAHPDRPPVLLCTTVSFRARRTAPFPRRGNALAFGTLFSSQGASADPKEGLQRWGRATSYCRHTALRRQPSLDRGRRRHGSEPSPNARRARIRNGRGLAGASAVGMGSRQQEGRPRTTCDRPELGPVHRHPSAVCEGAPGGMRFAADPLRRPRSPGRNRRHLGRRDARPARGPHHRT